MKTVNTLFVISLLIFLQACNALNIYKNAYEPVDRTNKEDWALISVSQGNEGHILISPRPKGNAFKAALSIANHNARAQILLNEGLNDINLYVFNGAYGALTVIEDVPIKLGGEYLVKYHIDDRKVTSWVVDKKTGQKIR